MEIIHQKYILIFSFLRFIKHVLSIETFTLISNFSLKKTNKKGTIKLVISKTLSKIRKPGVNFQKVFLQKKN